MVVPVCMSKTVPGYFDQILELSTFARQLYLYLDLKIKLYRIPSVQKHVATRYKYYSTYQFYCFFSCVNSCLRRYISKNSGTEFVVCKIRRQITVVFYFLELLIFDSLLLRSFSQRWSRHTTLLCGKICSPLDLLLLGK